MLGAFLCHPTIDAMMQDTATHSTIFGLPVIKMAFTVGESSKIFTYTESVIPILLAVILLALLERLLNKIVPEILQLILVPGLSLLIMVPVMLVVVGPVGIYVGYIIQWLYTALYSFSPVLGGIIVGRLRYLRRTPRSAAHRPERCGHDRHQHPDVLRRCCKLLSGRRCSGRHVQDQGSRPEAGGCFRLSVRMAGRRY